MKAAVFEEAGKVEVEDVAMPRESTPSTMATKQLGLWKKQAAPLRR